MLQESLPSLVLAFAWCCSECSSTSCAFVYSAWDTWRCTRLAWNCMTALNTHWSEVSSSGPTESKSSQVGSTQSQKLSTSLDMKSRHLNPNPKHWRSRQIVAHWLWSPSDRKSISAPSAKFCRSCRDSGFWRHSAGFSTGILLSSQASVWSPELTFWGPTPSSVVQFISV